MREGCTPASPWPYPTAARGDLADHRAPPREFARSQHACHARECVGLVCECPHDFQCPWTRTRSEPADDDFELRGPLDLDDHVFRPDIRPAEMYLLLLVALRAHVD